MPGANDEEKVRLLHELGVETLYASPVLAAVPVAWLANRSM